MSKEILDKLNQIKIMLDEVTAELSDNLPNQKPQALPKELPTPDVSSGPVSSVGSPLSKDKGDCVVAGVVSGESAIVTTERPEGKTGEFDGESVMIDGKKYQVPPNYVSKSRLVEGDKLKLMKIGDYNEFKLVEEVPRVSVEGILTKKDNQWVVLANNLNFRVISAAIRFYGGEIGDKVEIILPEGYEKKPPQWAAVENVDKKDVGSESRPSEPVPPPGVEKPLIKKGVVEKNAETISGEITFEPEQGKLESQPVGQVQLDDIPELR